MAQAGPAIANYDDQTAEEIKQRLRKLSQSDLARLEAYERQGQARSTVLEAIAALRGDEPWSGYDDMEVEEVNDALKRRDSGAAERVLEYERRHKARTTVMEFAKRRLDGSKPSATPSSEGSPPIADYDDHSTDEIVQRLPKLSQAELAELEAHEKQGQGRKKVLEAIAALRGDEPWSGYDDMGVEEVKDALKQRDRDAADRVVEYEGRHKARKPVIGFARSRSSSRAARPAKRSSSAPSQTGSKSSSSSRSSRSRSAGAARSKTRSKSSSRSSATRSSRSQQTKRSDSRRSKSHSTGATPSQADAREAVLAQIRQRATQAVRSGEGRANALAKDRQRAVGSKAKGSRRAVSAGADDTGQAVQSAASKAKTPALVGAAALAALGGGIALGRGSNVKLRKRKRVLGVPIPKRTAFGKAAKQVSTAVESAGSAGRQVSDLSDGLQQLRRKVTDGNSPASRLSGGKSAIEKLAVGNSPAPKLAGKSRAAALAKRVLS